VSNLRCFSRCLERGFVKSDLSDDPFSVSGAIGGYAIATLVPRDWCIISREIEKREVRFARRKLSADERVDVSGLKRFCPVFARGHKSLCSTELERPRWGKVSHRPDIMNHFQRPSLASLRLWRANVIATPLMFSAFGLGDLSTFSLMGNRGVPISSAEPRDESCVREQLQDCSCCRYCRILLRR